MNEDFINNEIINQNPNNINNNINNGNNVNNENNNNYMNFPYQRNNNNIKKYSKITISFLIILIINIYIELYSFFEIINSRKYIFQFAPIYDKNQYYRFISNYFIHYGIGHLIIELYITYKICNLMENIFGTIITISFIMISMLMNSILNFIILKFLIYFINYMQYSQDLNYEYESGMTSVLFTMVTFYFNFRHIKNKNLSIIYIFNIKAKYINFIALFSIYIFTPNKSFFRNLSGIINGYILKYLPFPFLPKVNWILDLENNYKIKCQIFENLYRYINEKNNLMVNSLNELQKNSITYNKNKFKKKKNYRHDFNNFGSQMSELSNN